MKLPYEEAGNDKADKKMEMGCTCADYGTDYALSYDQCKGRYDTSACSCIRSRSAVL